MGLAYSDKYPTDQIIIEGCRKKDKCAWDRFVERYSKVVYWAIRERLRRFGYIFNEKDVEDIHQDVFISLWEGDKLNQIRDISKTAVWLSMVAGNCAIDFFKRMKRQSPPNSISLYEEIYAGSEEGEKVLGDILPQNVIWPTQEARFNELRVIVENEMEGFDSKERIIMKLNLLHAMKYREIAQMLKVSINTVSTTIARGKKKLRDKLRHKGIQGY